MKTASLLCTLIIGCVSRKIHLENADNVSTSLKSKKTYNKFGKTSFASEISHQTLSDDVFEKVEKFVAVSQDCTASEHNCQIVLMDNNYSGSIS